MILTATSTLVLTFLAVWTEAQAPSPRISPVSRYVSVKRMAGVDSVSFLRLRLRFICAWRRASSKLRSPLHMLSLSSAVDKRGDSTSAVHARLLLGSMARHFGPLALSLARPVGWGS